MVLDFERAIQFERADQRVERRPAKVCYWSREAWASGGRYSPLAEDFFCLAEIVATVRLQCQKKKFLQELLWAEDLRITAGAAWAIASKCRSCHKAEQGEFA